MGSVYAAAMALEWLERGSPCERLKTVPVRHQAPLGGEHRWDWVLAACRGVENEAVREGADVCCAVMRSGLKATGPPRALGLSCGPILLSNKTGRFETGRFGPSRAAPAHPAWPRDRKFWRFQV